MNYCWCLLEVDVARHPHFSENRSAISPRRKRTGRSAKSPVTQPCIARRRWNLIRWCTVGLVNEIQNDWRYVRWPHVAIRRDYQFTTFLSLLALLFSTIISILHNAHPAFADNHEVWQCSVTSWVTCDIVHNFCTDVVVAVQHCTGTLLLLV